MKKLILGTMLLIFSQNVKAETIVVIDDNGYVKQQILTSNPYNSETNKNDSKLTVVRESPIVNNSYYYDEPSTAEAILTGVTTAIVGTLLYNEFRPNKPHHYKPKKSPPKNIHIPNKHNPPKPKKGKR